MDRARLAINWWTCRESNPISLSASQECDPLAQAQMHSRYDNRTDARFGFITQCHHWGNRELATVRASLSYQLSRIWCS